MIVLSCPLVIKLDHVEVQSYHPVAYALRLHTQYYVYARLLRNISYLVLRLPGLHRSYSRSTPLITAACIQQTHLPDTTYPLSPITASSSHRIVFHTICHSSQLISSIYTSKSISSSCNKLTPSAIGPVVRVPPSQSFWNKAGIGSSNLSWRSDCLVFYFCFAYGG